MLGNVTQDDDTLGGGYNSLDNGHAPLRSQECFGALIMAEQILGANGRGTWQERQAARDAQARQEEEKEVVVVGGGEGGDAAERGEPMNIII
jgi:hypothetical protein